MSQVDDDPALSEPLSALFERNNARPLPSHTPKSNPHTAASLSIRHALEKLPGWKRIRKRQVGKFIAVDKAGNPMRGSDRQWLYAYMAIKGDSDIEILWTPPGLTRPLAIMCEVKTGTGRLSEDQIEKKQHVESGGCFYVVAGNAADAFEACLLIAKSAKARAA